MSSSFLTSISISRFTTCGRTTSIVIVPAQTRLDVAPVFVWDFFAVFKRRCP